MDIEPVRTILDKAIFIGKCLFTAVLTICVLAWLLVPERDIIPVGSTYRDRDGNRHKAEQGMARDGNGDWIGKDGSVINGE